MTKFVFRNVIGDINLMCSKLLIKLLLSTYFLQVNSTAYVPAKVCTEGKVHCHVQSLNAHAQYKGLCVVKARL